MTPSGGQRGRRTAVLLGLVGATVVVVAVKGAGEGTSHAVKVGAGPIGTTGRAGSPSTRGAPATAPSTSAPSTTAPSTVPSTSGSSGPTTTAPTQQKLVGSPESFPFGTIQVEVIMSGGRITNVVTVQAPTDGYSAQVAGFSLPRLRQEVLQAQSARIDVVSGASYDSQAYAQSVQSALDRAKS